MAADLDSLITSEIPEGRQNLLDSHTNLEKVAEYCENNYFQCDNKRAALEETKGYTTQSLASVAYQINTLAYNFLQMLDLQSSQIQEMESQINHISQTVSIHKEKVARREIGVLTTNKCSNRQYKIIAPANPERPIKYERKAIDYSVLDSIGHGVKSLQKDIPRQMAKRPSAAGQYAPGNQYSGQYGPGIGKSPYGSIGNVSQNSAGPAPTTKPPTPPQNRFPSGTLNRSKDYRTPPVVAPPQVPSNYAPNYPKGSSRGGQQYGTLPHQHPQVGMVFPQPQEGGATMPRLSSSSMRSTLNSGTPTPPPHQEQPTYGGIARKPSSSSDMDPREMYGLMRQTSQASTGSRQSGQYAPGQGGQYAPGQPASQYAPGHPSQYAPGQNATYAQYGMMGGGGVGGRGSTLPAGSGGHYGSRSDRGSTPPSQYGMTRPTQRPPSPPPMTGPPAQNYGRPEQQPVFSRQESTGSALYSTRAQLADQTYSSRGQLQQEGGGGSYSRQNSGSSLPPGAVPIMGGLMAAAAAASSSPAPVSSAVAANPPPPPSGPISSTGIVVRDVSLPGWVPKNYLEKVVAIYDYNADKEDELTFQEGQTIYVLKKNDDGWWEGVMEGITGLFPGNYVEQSV